MYICIRILSLFSHFSLTNTESTLPKVGTLCMGRDNTIEKRPTWGAGELIVNPSVLRLGGTYLHNLTPLVRRHQIYLKSTLHHPTIDIILPSIFWFLVINSPIPFAHSGTLPWLPFNTKRKDVILLEGKRIPKENHQKPSDSLPMDVGTLLCWVSFITIVYTRKESLRRHHPFWHLVSHPWIWWR